jgi:hypothetical protein
VCPSYRSVPEAGVPLTFLFFLVFSCVFYSITERVDGMELVYYLSADSYIPLKVEYRKE